MRPWFFGGLFLILVVIVSLDYIADIVVDKITLEQEVQWFGKLAARQSGDQTPSEKKVSKLISNLWLPYSENQKVSFNIALLPESDMNAFTALGGNFYFTVGLLEKTKSLNSLGFVICHELGHFYHRHVLKNSGRGILVSLFLLVLGLDGAGKGLLEAGASALTLKFSRDDERQADSFAIDCQQKYFGHIGGFDEFFRNINKTEAAIPAFLSTHPKSLARIEELKILAIERGYSVDGELTTWQISESDSEGP